MTTTRGSGAHGWWRRRPGRWARLDLVLAAALTLLVQGEVWFADVAPRATLAVAAFVCTASLVGRRRAPAATAMACCSASLAVSLLTTSWWPPQLVLLPVLVAVHSAGARLHGRAAAATGAAAFVLVWAASASTRDGDVGDFFPWVLWLAAWGTGVLLRNRTLAVDELALRAATAETSRDAALQVLHEVQAREAEAAARERARIARDLHDVVAHAVSVIVVQAGAERMRLGDGAPQTTAALRAIEEAGRDALRELRTMLGVLVAPGQPPAVPAPPVPGGAQVMDLVARVRAAGLPVRVRDAELVASLPPGVGLTAYRIVQESLTNVCRHQGLVPTELTFRRGPQLLEVLVRSGPGPEAGSRAADSDEALAAGSGRGVIGMRERASALGGRLTASARGDMFVVHAVLPVPPAADGSAHPVAAAAPALDPVVGG